MQAIPTTAKTNTPSALLQQSHYPSIDGLRAVSIIIVVLCHVLFDTPLRKYFDGGIGVEIFFVISGFLITTLLQKEQTKFGKISLKKFYIRRVLRIVPVAVLFVLVLMVLNVIFKLNITKTSFVLALLYLKNMPIPSGIQD